MTSWRQWEGAVWCAAADGPLSSATLNLLQGIGMLAPAKAHAVLRGPIGVGDVPDALDAAAIRILGRKWTVAAPPEGLRIDVGPAARWLRRTCPAWVGSSPPWRDPRDEREWMALAGVVARAGASRGRQVGAVLAGADGRILAASAHRTVGRRADHAELLLAQRWVMSMGTALPGGSTLFVTREPCRMCAAALVRVRPLAGRLDVVYGEVEDGSAARGSALALAGMQRIVSS